MSQTKVYIFLDATAGLIWEVFIEVVLKVKVQLVCYCIVA